MELPLAGVKVLEISQMLAAPGTAMYLADLGAAVIKVEPLWGDQARQGGGLARSFLALNRNKKGIALDITKPEGLKVVLSLAERSDVLLHNFRPGVAERLGIGYETMRSLNPGIIYAHLTAYGTEGPYANQPGYDFIIQGLTGIMAASPRVDGAPAPSVVWAADCSAPMLLAYGIVAALHARQKTGEGRKVETSLLNAAIAIQSAQLVFLEQDNLPSLETFQPTYHAYPTKDEKYINIVTLNEKEWRNLCRVLDIEHLANDPDFNSVAKRAEHREELYPILDTLFRLRTAEEWLKLLQEAEVPCGPIVPRLEVFDQPQVRINQMVVEAKHPEKGRIKMMGVPLRFSGVEQRLPNPAPLLGQHTDEILAGLGYSIEEIARLRRDGVIL